jgi:hypothetical protein
MLMWFCIILFRLICQKLCFREYQHDDFVRSFFPQIFNYDSTPKPKILKAMHFPDRVCWYEIKKKFKYLKDIRLNPKVLYVK